MKILNANETDLEQNQEHDRDIKRGTENTEKNPELKHRDEESGTQKQCDELVFV